MTRRCQFGIWLTTIGWLALATAARCEPPAEVRVVTYNIHHGEGLDGKVDLPRIAAVLRSVSPDLIAIEEVDQGTERTARVDMPAEFAKLTGMQVVFGRNIDFQGGGYGTAVLSRLPVRHSESHKLPSHYDGEQRGVQVIELGEEPRSGDADKQASNADADGLVLFCTHLDYRSDDAERMDSVKTIDELAAQFGNRPMILAGDLNAVPDSRVLQGLQEHWRRANKEVLPTFPAGKPERQIDYVLVRPTEGWQTVQTRVLDEAIASDHRPLLAVLKRVH